MKGKLDSLGGFFSQTTKPRWERSRPDNPEDSHMGWAFAKFDNEEPDATPDPLEGAKFIRDLYEIADPSTGKFTVPVLWDKVHTLVSTWLFRGALPYYLDESFSRVGL